VYYLARLRSVRVLDPSGPASRHDCGARVSRRRKRPPAQPGQLGQLVKVRLRISVAVVALACGGGGSLASWPGAGAGSLQGHGRGSRRRAARSLVVDGSPDALAEPATATNDRVELFADVLVAGETTTRVPDSRHERRHLHRARHAGRDDVQADRQWPQRRWQISGCPLNQSKLLARSSIPLGLGAVASGRRGCRS